ncbi:MAG TPA: SAM-dependent methyltransferase [Micromonosporaceae bacterium]|nr:SAM-dependent methyltransferase [Micromonosporaceae bacterium]
MTDSQSATGQEPFKIDTSVAHPARVWDYWLGGKDNYPADREVGDNIQSVMPDIAINARADREFLGRVVRYLVGRVGIRQFLDIGTGIPSANNTHEVAQATAPECRIVYVDNDPIVLAHARALLIGLPQGATAYVDADLREPDKILKAAARTLDFRRPVAIMLLGILEFVTDNGEAQAILDRLLDAAPSGSYLAIAHPATEDPQDAMGRALRAWNDSGAPPVAIRSRADLARFFRRLELVDPGVVPLPRWRPDPGTRYADREVLFFGAVGRKP